MGFSVVFSDSCDFSSPPVAMESGIDSSRLANVTAVYSSMATLIEDYLSLNYSFQVCPKYKWTHGSSIPRHGASRRSCDSMDFVIVPLVCLCCLSLLALAPFGSCQVQGHPGSRGNAGIFVTENNNSLNRRFNKKREGQKTKMRSSVVFS